MQEVTGSSPQALKPPQGAFLVCFLLPAKHNKSPIVAMPMNGLRRNDAACCSSAGTKNPSFKVLHLLLDLD
jgi:hypothetical protein